MWNSALTFAIVINELMASNAGSVMSPAVNFDSWIELYNPTEQTIDLAGMYLSNNENNLTRWQMPNDIGTLPAKGHLVVWLGSNDIKSNQAPFKLNCDGGSIFLSDQNGQLITSMQYPEAKSRTAYARTTDGGEEWGWTATPTPGESNAKAVYASERLDAPVVNQGSQLFNGTLNIKVTIPEGTKLMYTTDGSLPVSLDGLDPYTNRLKNSNCEGSDASCFLCHDGNTTGNVNRITDGAGVDGSRGIKVHSVANASSDRTTQFFVYTPDYTWKTGEKFRFRMKVRADHPTTITNVAQKTPGQNLVNNILGGEFQVTTEWQDFVYEGTLTKEQAGEKEEWNWWYTNITYSLQTIAFNLNKKKDTDNNFYFDDIYWEVMDDNINSQESTTGEFTISQTTNLTFRLFRDGYLPSVPVTRSYIRTSNNYTLPIISIVGNRKFFTDPKIGLDCDGDGTNGKTGNGQDTPKNYNMDWDRPVNFSYLSPDGQMLFNQDVNISVSGGWTRAQSKRSFKLKSNKIFDGQNRFDYSFFPQKPYIRSKTLLLRNGGNDMYNHNARFMDPALETIIQRSGIDLDVQSYVPVIEYVNGELRGVLNLREPNNANFAYANWGYVDEELDAFENMQMKNGNDSVINRIFELGANATDDAAYEELKTLLDIDEFTNYMAVTMFLDNDDWPNNNIKAYRSRNNGRYRFVSFDLDYAFALRKFNKDNDDPFKYFVRFKDADKVYNEDNKNREIVRLFLNLLGREDYRRKFTDTFCLVGGSVFEPTRAGKIVDELLNNVKAMCQLMQQQGINDGHEPSKAASTIKTKLKGRAKKMATSMKNFSYLDLKSTTAQNVILSTDTKGATLLVNGMEVPYADFNGYLFAPVELTAKAPAGYRFAGWKKGSQQYASESTITLPTDATVQLTATFTPFSDSERETQGYTPVCVNEVSAANSIFVNELFKRNDWVELYNNTDDAIDVEGMYLSDNAEKPTKFQIVKTDGVETVISPHDYLIIWCDKLEPQSQLHASFKLAAEGGDVLLSADDQSWTSRLTYAAHNEDQTVGRYPDGGNQVYVMNVPTIAKSNIMSSYATIVAQQTIETTGISDIMAQQSDSQQIYNLKGQAVQGTLKPGIYIRNGKKILIK